MDKIKLIESIEKKIEEPFITSKFGSNWKKHAKENYSIDDITHLAWKQGRKAILLQEALEKLCDELTKKDLSVPNSIRRLTCNNCKSHLSPKIKTGECIICNAKL